MLNTTALALGDQEVADLANHHLRDYAMGVIALHYIIPAVVVRSLQKEGLPVREDILNEVSRNVAQAWGLGKTGQTHIAGAAPIQGPPSR